MNIIKQITSRKYRFFQKKIKDVQYSMWDLDFKIMKARQMREESRQMRDRSVEALQMAKANPKPDEEAIKQIALNIKGYEAQMDLVDQQIQGVKATTEEAGQNGIIDTVAGLANLRELYKEYLRQI